MFSHSNQKPWQPFGCSIRQYEEWKLRKIRVTALLFVCVIVMHITFAIIRPDHLQIIMVGVYTLCAWAVGFNLFHAWRWNNRYNHPDCRIVHNTTKSMMWFDATKVAERTGLEREYIRIMLQSFMNDELLTTSTNGYLQHKRGSKLDHLVRADS